MRRSLVLATATALLAIFAVGTAHADELSDLQKKMKKRYPTLLDLRQAGKIGETYLGYLEAREAKYRKEKVKVGDKETTVGAVVDDENSDRSRVYEILAKKKGGTKEAIAKFAAKLHFKKAGPEEWLKTKDGWKKKKDLKEK